MAFWGFHRCHTYNYLPILPIAFKNGIFNTVVASTTVIIFNDLLIVPIALQNHGFWIGYSVIDGDKVFLSNISNVQQRPSLTAGACPL